MIERPQPDEYVAFYAGYVGLIPQGGDVIAMLAGQPDALRSLLRERDDASTGSRPAPEEWSIKEVIGHMADTERVFAYRLMRVARGDTTPLPGFDQDEYMASTDFNARSLADLLDEFDYQRRANLVLVKSLSEAEINRAGSASGHPVTARALIYMLAGHAEHHLISLRTVYLGG